MKPIAAELEAVLQQYKTEVRPALARLAPDGHGLGVYRVMLECDFAAAAREAKEEAERFGVSAC
jgi:hypothetical protein